MYPDKSAEDAKKEPNPTNSGITHAISAFFFNLLATDCYTEHSCHLHQSTLRPREHGVNI